MLKIYKSIHVEGNVEIFMNGSEIDWRKELERKGLKDLKHVWKHIPMISFKVSHCITFQGCECLIVFNLKLLKKFHNIFSYYVRI